MRTRTVGALAALALLLVAALLFFASGGDARPPAPVARADAAPPPAAAPVQPADPAAGAAADAAAATSAVQRTELAERALFTVRGRAVRGVDQPVPGARVRARAFHGAAADGEPFVDALLTADGAGEFAWPLEPPTALVFLDLRGDGKDVRSYPETLQLAPGDAPPEPFDLWIVPLDGVVRGRVVDQDGKPIATARVGNDAASAAAVDAEGRFELRASRGDAHLVALANGFVTARQSVPVDPTGVGEVELRLRSAVRIHGTVRDELGQPIAGAAVKTFYTIYEPAVHTAADGRFTLDNLDPGQQSHSLFARCTGYLEGKAEVVTKGPDTEQDLVLKRGVALRGVVVDASTGAPVPAATVFVGFSPSAYDRLDAVTDADGRFAFDCVAAGDQKVNVERRGWAAARQQVPVPAAPAPAVELRIALDRGHFTGGVLVDGDGKPVPRVSIAPRLLGEYVDGIRARTDAQGKFRLDGVPKGDLELEFYGGGIVRHVAPVPVVDRDDLHIVVERHGYIAGTVVDGSSGAPVARFRIRFGTPQDTGNAPRASGYSASWHRGGKEFSDAAGTFRIDEELRIGSVLALEASAAGYGPTVVDPVTVTRAADPSQLMFKLWPAATIAGVVRDAATDAPIAGARLIAWLPGRPRAPSEPNDDDGRPLATSAADGSFTLAGVGVGDVHIHVARDGWLEKEHGPIAVAAGQPVPAQVVQLSSGVTLTLALQAKGAPVAGAAVTLWSSTPQGHSAPTGTTDVRGEVRLPNLAPGRYSAMIRRDAGGRPSTSTWLVVVEGADRRAVLSLDAGDASLQIVVECDEPLPADLTAQIVRGQQHQDGAFVSTSVPLDGGRALARELPAGDLAVMVFAAGGDGSWSGSCKVTATSGAVTEARVRLVHVAQRR